MQIETRRFGTIEVADDEHYEVPDGIPGFRSMRRVALFAASTTPVDVDAGDDDDDEPVMYWIQDLDDGGLAFLAIVPWSVFPGYDLEIDEVEFGIADDSNVRVLNLVTVRRTDDEPALTANLRAPIVVDVDRRRLHQVILGDSRWSIHEPVTASATSGVR